MNDAPAITLALRPAPTSASASASAVIQTAPPQHWDAPLPAHPGRGAPVGWRMTARMAARRERMRATGAQLLHEYGPEGIALMDIARAADVPASVSSHGYRRRHELVFDILHAYADALHEYVGAADDAARAGQAGRDSHLHRLVTALLLGMREHRPAHDLWLAARAHLPVAEQEALRYLHRTLLYRLAPPLEAALPRLRRRRDLLAPLLRSLMAMAAASPLWLHPRGSLDLDAYARLIVAAVLAGGRTMLARPQSPDSGTTP